MLAQQRTFTNARAGCVGVYFAGFTEPLGRLIEYLRSFRFGDEAPLGRAVHLVSLGAAVLEGMDAIEENVLQTVRQTRAALVVLDGYCGLRGVLESETEAVRFLYRYPQFEQLVARAASRGFDLAGALARGPARLLVQPPLNLDPDLLASQLQEALVAIGAG